MRLVRDIVTQEFSFFFATPAILWQLFFLYVPLIGILVFSFLSSDMTSLTFVHYTSLLSLPFFKVILNSLILASLTAVLSLCMAYPIAYYIALYVSRYKMVLLFGLILPSWTNFIVQIYAWFFLLERNGVYSRILYWLGFTSEPINLLNSFGATLACMVYCFMPFMIFPIYVVLDKMDKRLIEASCDLGANRFQTFCRVVLPLSLPGIYVGLLLVFIPSFGEFAIPLLVGGAKNMYWGMVIVDKFLLSQDWASGFAFASLGVLLITVLILTCVAIRSLLGRAKKNRHALQIKKTVQQQTWGIHD